MSTGDPVPRNTWRGMVGPFERIAHTSMQVKMRDHPVLHLLLFAAALGSAIIAGGFLAGTDVLDTRFVQIGGSWFPVPSSIAFAELGVGLPFALAFIGILLGHELGHYLAARRNGVPVSLPYFIPFPPYFSLVGTLGAFIRIRGRIARRSVLFDIGVAGPVVSFLLSLPVLFVGLRLSEIVPGGDAGLYPFLVHFVTEPVQIGSSVLLHAAAVFSVPGFEPGATVLLHPLAFAGWLGIFVTALNLLPLGQLDGGHILYALAGPGQRRIGMAFLLLLLPLGFVWWGWWLWGGVVLVLGRGKVAHPSVTSEEEPLGKGRTILGWTSFALLLVCFSPAPLRL